MPTLQSAGVNVTEIDLTTIVPSVATTEGAIAGVFRWGPVGERILVDSETSLVNRVGKPTTLNKETFFTAANFLGYGNRLYISRAANTTGGTNNDVMSALANVGVVSNLTSFNVKNQADYQSRLDAGTFLADTDVQYIAKYPGDLGNSLKVSVCDSAAAWSSNVSLIANTTANATASLVTANIGSNTVTVTIVPANTADSTAYATVNLLLQAVANSLTVGDLIQVGNNVTSKQTVRIQSIAASANAFYQTTNSISFSNNSNMVTLTLGNTFGYAVGMLFSGNNVPALTTITAVTNSTAFTISANTTAVQSGPYIVNLPSASFAISVNNKIRTKMNIADTRLLRFWEYSGSFDRAPGQSLYLANKVTSNLGAANSAAKDEMHIIVVDEDGVFSGVPGTILERFRSLSRIKGAKSVEGASIYYADAINKGSQYIWWGNDRIGAVTGTTPLTIASSTNVTPLVLSFAGGQDGLDEANIDLVNLYNAYDLFKSKNEVDISLMMQGKAVGPGGPQQLANYLIDNIVGPRGDCVLFVSPNIESVVNNIYNEINDVVAFRNGITDTSFAVMDSGYKYQYDRYNDGYVWVPLNGDIAGLCARTDGIADPWFSPAGLNRGIIKNVVKLAYNPAQADRDTLYKSDINPVINIPGTGPLLYGDKTLQGKPSAFDRINVRRLFITLEKAISKASKYTLFEFNDSFTRSQFRNLIEPYLRDVQGRRGIYDFLVVCDETNNTPEVIDANQFVGDIFIKPARSINFIQLNFVAVRTGVAFNEIIGFRT